MDSPVIVDTASKFGRNLDPGFGFDDEGFGRRNKDIRSHLDDLAARHPEFADHLLGPPWGDFTLPRRRGSGASHQSHPDEDTRSQASGSSAASAASGASGVSSHGDPETIFEESQTKIPQYGLRNTVDTSQNPHNMQNQDKGGRGQRSMSAPPENRPDDNQPQEGQNPRFVSRVDITPKFNNQTTDKSSKPQQSQGHPKQQQSNVRHIPIFVEGRDEPVIAKSQEEAVHNKQPSPPRFTSQPSPPRYHQSFDSPPHFHRPSHFTSERFGRPREWKQFTEDVFDGPFEEIRRTHSPFRQQAQRQPRGTEPHFQSPQQPPQQERPPEKARQEPEPDKPKQQIQPKDPLERVALVQQEVDSLHEQVKLWNGNTRQDKQYIYLDEMLTRELIKLDDIDTEGKEAVRQSRKNTIKSIQDAISLLESKAPLPGQTPVKELSSPPEFNETTNEGQSVSDAEPMDMEKKPEDEVKPIPLPAPSSPIKESAAPQDDSPISVQGDTAEEVPLPDPNVAIPMEGIPDSTAMEVQTDQEQKNRATNEDTPKISKSPKKVKKTKKQTPVSVEPIPLPGPESHQTN
ncbi:BAG domain-containing protein Samui isoform X2 [Fopius arisanus]|uniref:BAG domain-containing protein Samui isoform X2 n=1 Tax=Fopius arisanus TaxID=64838 RepID=A0A0C9PXW3_9HYME|nr:PREDICTED: BAG domain-containing protein Samui isoform X2 [Fopius arisanus]